MCELCVYWENKDYKEKDKHLEHLYIIWFVKLAVCLELKLINLVFSGVKIVSEVLDSLDSWLSQSSLTQQKTV